MADFKAEGDFKISAINQVNVLSERFELCSLFFQQFALYLLPTHSLRHW